MLSQRVVTGICITVTALWGGSVARQIVDDSYKPDPAINAVFGGTVGTALALGGKNQTKPERERRR